MVPSTTTYLRSVKNRSDLRSSEGETHMSGVSSSNRVHGKTTSLVGRSGKRSLGISIDGSGHLKLTVLTNTEGGGSAESINTRGGNGDRGNRKRRELHGEWCVGIM